MHTARRASGSPAAHFPARTDLTARGVIYLLVGWVIFGVYRLCEARWRKV